MRSSQRGVLVQHLEAPALGVRADGFLELVQPVGESLAVEGGGDLLRGVLGQRDRVGHRLLRRLPPAALRGLGAEDLLDGPRAEGRPPQHRAPHLQQADLEICNEAVL